MRRTQMTLKIMTHKDPYIIEVYRGTTAIMIEDDGEPFAADVETREDGTKVYSFGDWSKVKDYV